MQDTFYAIHNIVHLCTNDQFHYKRIQYYNFSRNGDLIIHDVTYTIVGSRVVGTCRFFSFSFDPFLPLALTKVWYNKRIPALATGSPRGISK